MCVAGTQSRAPPSARPRRETWRATSRAPPPTSARASSTPESRQVRHELCTVVSQGGQMVFILYPPDFLTEILKFCLETTLLSIKIKMFFNSHLIL